MTFPSIKSEEDFGDAVEALENLLVLWFPELQQIDPNDDSTFRVGTVWPGNVYEKLPVVRLTSIGGNDDGLTDYPLIDVDVLHFTDTQAKSLARRIRAKLLGAPHWSGGVLISKVRTAMRPHPVPWDDDRVARYYGSYVAEVPR
jgi:hypothetical protein